MNNMASVRALNDKELELGITGSASWHHKYKDSAWVYVGGLANELTEGDVICVLSQFGEIEDFNMPRDAKTGKPRGWAWVKFEDQRSTILAVDNANGASLLRRTLRVDHCEKYKLPPELREKEEEEEASGKYGPASAMSKFAPGAVYEGKELASAHDLHRGIDVFAKPEKQKKAECVKLLPPPDKKKDKKKEKKKKKDDKDEERKTKRQKTEKKKKKKTKKDDEPQFGLVSEVLPMTAPASEPTFADLPLQQPSRQGEVVAPSWRGNREPGGPSDAFSARRAGSEQQPFGGGNKNWTPKVGASQALNWQEREKERNRSYGGLQRKR